MIDTNHFLSAWFSLECIGISRDILSRIKGNTCDDVEAFLITLDNLGYQCYFRHDFPIDLSVKILSSDAKYLFENEKYTRDILLQNSVNIIEIRREITYCFLDMLQVDIPDIVFLGDTHETFDTFAILHNGKAVSRAWSIRRNDNAAEIAVETKEKFRRMGYGKQVVLAWAEYILSLGKEAIYSHRKGNLESQALANSVGAKQFVEVLSFHTA